MSTNLEDFDNQLEAQLDPAFSLDPTQTDFLAFIESIINPDTKPTNLMNTVNYIAPNSVASNSDVIAGSSQSSSTSSFVLPSLLPPSSNSSTDTSLGNAYPAPEQSSSSVSLPYSNNCTLTNPDRLGAVNEQQQQQQPQATTTRPAQNQFIDLTKENDDIIILNATSTSRTNKSNPSRRMINRRNSNRSLNRLNTFSNETNDPDSPLIVEILSNPNRPVVLNDPANATIILDDGHDRSVNYTSRAYNSHVNTANNINDNSVISEIVDDSPPKRQRTDAYSQSSSSAAACFQPKPSTSSSIAPTASSNLPQCPICLENLDELKLHGKTLMATHCGHILCNNCLNQTFKSGSGNAKSILCPSCRTRLTRAKVHSLYL